MTSQRASYVHNPLDRTRRQIRLLQVLPKRTAYGLGEAVRIQLGIFDLQDAPKFTAVSYEWGSATLPSAVVVENTVLYIRRNLGSFLWHFRNDALIQDLYLWIDQICINQNSVHEKNHQVSLMSSIFWHAEEVLVWLGARASAQTAFQAVRAVVNLAGNKAAPRVTRRGSRPPKATIDLRGWGKRELAQLYGLSYWKRHWIAQELALAKSCVLMYGTQHLPWYILDFSIDHDIVAERQHVPWHENDFLVDHDSLTDPQANSNAGLPADLLDLEQLRILRMMVKLSSRVPMR